MRCAACNALGKILRQVRLQFTVCSNLHGENASNCAATLLAFGPRTAIATFAAITASAPAPTPPALAAKVAFATRFAAILAALKWLAAFAARR